MGNPWNQDDPPVLVDWLDEWDFDAVGDWHQSPFFSIPGDGFAYHDSVWSGGWLSQLELDVNVGPPYICEVDIISTNRSLDVGFYPGASKRIYGPGVHQVEITTGTHTPKFELVSVGDSFVCELASVRLWNKADPALSVVKAFTDEWNFLPSGSRFYEVITAADDYNVIRGCNRDDFSHCLIKFES